MSRMNRQKTICAWDQDEFGFGFEYVTSRERALRFLKEALELIQAVGLSPGDVFNMTYDVFAQPAGEIKQKFGGVGVTLLSLGESLGIDVDHAEMVEYERFLDKVDGYFKARQQAKAEQGVAF